MSDFKNIWKSKSITGSMLQTKRGIVVTCVISVVLHACKTWKLKKKRENKLMAFEMRCYRRILNVRWQHKITTKEIRERMGSKRNIIQRNKERKLNLFGHISVELKITDWRDGRENKKRKTKKGMAADDVMEWCNEELYILKKKAQDRD